MDGTSLLQEAPVDSPEQEVSGPELTVVMPCLNEADTLAECIRVTLATFEAHGIDGEVLIADNGSDDGSAEIAEREGARVVNVPMKGYGSALMGGFEAARGRYVMMGDADLSYDFTEIPRFLEELRKGKRLVQGCRLESGGGTVEPGAMPFLHRWLGNPVLSFLTRLWFDTEVQDVHCGLRGFDRDLPSDLDLRCSGMEFATEMIVKAAAARVDIGQVPITLRPDGRVNQTPHLRTWRDGWRHLRFMLLWSPRWLFFLPGLVMMTLGAVAAGIALPRLNIAGVQFDVHTLLFGGLGIILGYQAIWFATLAGAFGAASQLGPTLGRSHRKLRGWTLERGLQLGLVVVLAGLILLGAAFQQWVGTGFGDLDYQNTMRLVIPGAVVTVVGSQTLLGSFFLGVLELPQK